VADVITGGTLIVLFSTIVAFIAGIDVCVVSVSMSPSRASP
jgi:hypothetical protein